MYNKNSSFVGWATTALLWRYRRNGSFRNLEADHEDFYKAMQRINSSYKWPLRPLYEWSRRIEYPFVVDNLADMPPSLVLDAGSGVTFFPYFLVKKYGHQVECLDHDCSFGSIMERVCEGLSYQVRIPFYCGDITQQLPFDSQSYDVVYSISVLEHIEPSNRMAAISELWRLVRFGGKLVLTLDIALEPQAEGIPINNVQSFLNELCKITSYLPDFQITPKFIVTPQTPHYSILPTIIGKKEIIRAGIKSVYRDFTRKPLPRLKKLACLLLSISKPS